MNKNYAISYPLSVCVRSILFVQLLSVDTPIVLFESRLLCSSINYYSNLFGQPPNVR